MQSLARDGLTAEQVTAILTSPALQVAGGLDLLRPDLTFVSDISADLESGKVTRNLFADIHGACSLRLSRELVWGVDLVRPHMTLTDGRSGQSARFNLGVFLLTTPTRTVGQDPVTVEVQGYDRLVLLERQVGADYTVAAGVTYRQALLDTFTAAGLTGALIEGAAADDVLPAARSWPLVADRAADPDQTNTPVTWLRIVNDLLRAISFRSVFCDELGRYRCQAYVLPSAQPVEFTFDADDVVAGIVGEDRSVDEDVWKTPNRWVFRQTNRPAGALAPTEGDGIFTVVNQSDGPTSIDSRGLVWTSVVDYEAASQAKLVELGNRRVQLDRALTTVFSVTVGPFPPAGHADVYRYVDGGDRRVQLLRHDLDLLGADSAMTWEAVT